MRLNIIGCGRAGGTVAAALAQTGQFEIAGIHNRTPESAVRAAQLLGGGRAVNDAADFERAEAWLIGTTDDAIAGAATFLAQSGKLDAGCTVFHLSGRYGPEVLEPVRAAGAEVAGVHPVRSMPALSTQTDEFRGTVCIAEGSEGALHALSGPFTAAGAAWNEVSGLDRGLYHAALAIISNVTKGVIWKAQNWLEQAGLDAETAAEASHSLLSITAEDVFNHGVRHSITGPVVRGDTRTVEAHLEALRAIGGHDAEVYRILARTVLELANERGDLGDEVLARFEALLARPEA